jgi:hypothetical protein
MHPQWSVASFPVGSPFRQRLSNIGDSLDYKCRTLLGLGEDADFATVTTRYAQRAITEGGCEDARTLA